MKHTAVLIAIAGLSHAALGATSMRVQVSRALQEDWQSSIQASTGDSIDVRVVIGYSGTDSPIGLSFACFQPTVSNWLASDTMLPLVNGGLGGQVTVPVGAVQDLPGQYGRVIPYAQVAMTSSTFLRGHTNLVNGTNYLRIAQAQVTNWIGGLGNTSGGSGGNNLQLGNIGRTTQDPPFNPATTNVVVFKFGITLSPSDVSVRTMLADLPIDGIYRGNNGTPHVEWYRSLTEVTGSLHEPPTITPASIFVNVPAPAALGLVVPGLALARRRRN